jgi:hypothetical protein
VSTKTKVYTLEHIYFALIVGVGFTIGAVSINLIDLDHTCYNCTLEEYFRSMIKGTYSDNPQDTALLERGVLHSPWILWLTFLLASFFNGASLGLALHYIGDYL